MTPNLPNRIRELLAPLSRVEEKRMFGGLAFLINGNMSVAASGQGGLLHAGVTREDTDKLVGGARVSPMVMAGREVRGWLRVDASENQTPATELGHARRGLCAQPAAQMTELNSPLRLRPHPQPRRIRRVRAFRG